MGRPSRESSAIEIGSDDAFLAGEGPGCLHGPWWDSAGDLQHPGLGTVVLLWFSQYPANLQLQAGC